MILLVIDAVKLSRSFSRGSRRLIHSKMIANSRERLDELAQTRSHQTLVWNPCQFAGRQHTRAGMLQCLGGTLIAVASINFGSEVSADCKNQISVS